MSGKHSFKSAQLSQQVAALTALLVKHGITVPASVRRPRAKVKSVQQNTTVHANGVPSAKDHSSPDANASSSSNWTTVKSSGAKEPAKGPSDILQSEGWSVPVVSVHVLEDVTTSTCGVALVTMATGKHLVSHGVRVDVSLGLLLPAPVPGKEDDGVLISVVVQDKLGKLQVRQRYLYQLGPEPVVLNNAAPRVEIVNDTAKALLIVDQCHVTAEIWQAVQTRAKSAARPWMKNRVGVSVLDVHPPTRLKDHPGTVQMVVQLGSVQDQQKLLAAAGLDGIWSRMFLTGPSDREHFKIVPLPFGVTFPQARDKALFLGELSCGAVPCGKGFGIRVLASNFEQVLQKIRPADADLFLGKQWEISGLPCSCGENALRQMLQGWSMRPAFTFRVGQGLRATRTWIVRSVQEPTVSIVQHQFGLALVKEFVRTPREKKPVQVMKARPQNLTEDSPFPKSWAAVVATGTDSHVNTSQQAASASRKRSALDAAAAGTNQVAMSIDTPSTQQMPAIGPSIPVLSLQEQIAQAVASAIQPLMGLSVQVRTLQEEIAAMRADVVDGSDEEDGAEVTAVSFPSAVPPQRTSHTAFKPY